MAIKFTYMDHNFWRVSDRDASKLAKASPLGRLPKLGNEVSIDMGEGRIGWLQRTQNLYGHPRSKRGWVWAVYYTGKLNPPLKWHRKQEDIALKQHKGAMTKLGGKFYEGKVAAQQDSIRKEWSSKPRRKK